MTITELIAQLEAIKAEHGDLPCITYNLNNEERPAKVSFVGAKWRQDTAQPLMDAIALI